MGTTNQYGYGSRGSGVSNLQKLLNKAGFNLTVDGIFGNKTLSAVKKYQQDNGLAVDGIAGKNTLASLNGTGSGKASNKATNNATPKTTNKNTGFTYDDFSYKDYTESDAVKQAKDALDTQLSKKPGDYTSKWQTQLDDIYNKIMNREDFSYDFNQDALYQQYKDKYIQQGKMAMADTMGQASAMTGGYGSSYAQSVGQQAYNEQLQNLNDVIPELYQMAYDKYNREEEDLYNQYALTMGQEELDYGRYRDSVSDWNAERDYLANRYDSERDYDYSKYTDDRNFDYGVYSDGRDLAYSEHRNAIEDEQWQKAYDYQKDRDRVADEQWEKEFNLAQAEYNQKVLAGESTEKKYSGTKSDGGSYNNGSLTTSQVKELQATLGVTADGYYGEQSKGAAGGLSAQEAYNKYVKGGGDNEGDDAPTYDSIVNDLNTYIKNGASRSNISTYLRNALKDGYISQDQYNKLKETFLPNGGSSGGRPTY